MRRTTVLAALLVLALGLLTAGCLSGTDQTATADTVVGEAPVPEPDAGGEDLPALALTGDAAAGKTVFTANCGGCHTLADAGTTGTVGPNLDDKTHEIEVIVTNVTNGKGAMPPFGESLTAQQIADVAAYVNQSTGG